MSEYQYYEFLAIDRPLSAGERAEVRALSTRASITATSFVNEYHWGDFKGDPNQLMERYYDAHLYVTDWGTHRVMFRLPRDLLDPGIIEDYCVGDAVVAWNTGEFVVLELTSEDQAGDFDFDHATDTLLSPIAGIRAELTAGDLRPLYLAWLAAYGAWERDEDVFDRSADDDPEPPVPPGLGTLSAAQRALADFLRLDDDLLAVAAQASPSLPETTDDPDDLASWVAHLPVTEKDRLLIRVVGGEIARVRMELLGRFRGGLAPGTPVRSGRTVADLLDDTARRRADRERRQAVEHAEHAAHREQALREARDRRLTDLTAEQEAAWSRLEELIDTRKPTCYDDTVTLLTELRALAEREGNSEVFALRALELRREHRRKSALIERLDRAGI